MFSLKRAYQRFCHRYLGLFNKAFSLRLLFRFKGGSKLVKRTVFN